MMKMFWKFIDVMVTQHCECTQCYGIVFFQMIRFYVRRIALQLKKEKIQQIDRG